MLGDVMDPLAAIGIASTIVTFVELSSQFVQRLEELQQSGDVPEAFLHVKVRLPLISSILRSFEESPKRFPADTEVHVKEIVDGCSILVEEAKSIIQRVTVKHTDSRWRKGYRAVISFTEEGRLQHIATMLRENMQILTSLSISTISNNEHPRRESLSGYLSGENATAKQNEYLFLIPFTRDDQFVGRNEILEDIETKFRLQQRAALAGMGGIGKSQIAIEYAYRFRSANPEAHVFWVYGGSPPRFYQGFKNIAQQLRLPSWDDPDADKLDLVLTWLNTTSTQFLLILDNADNINYYLPDRDDSLNETNTFTADLSQYLPEHRGKVLITTRDLRVAKRLAKSKDPIVLPTLTEEEAKHLFILHGGADVVESDPGAVSALVEFLGHLPLAITQAASFISETGTPIDEYLTSLQSSNPIEFLKQGLYDARRDGNDHDDLNSAYRAWQVSFNQILKQSPAAADLLYLMAMFDRQNIPRELLRVEGSALSLSTLQSLHMITARAGSKGFSLHRLTQLFVQISLVHSGEFDLWKSTSLSILSKNYPTEIGVLQWPVCEALAPHVEYAKYLTKDTALSLDARLDLANLICWAADFDIERGLLVQALAGAKRSFELYRSVVPENDEGFVSAEWLYGRLLFYQATSSEDVRKAEAHLQHSLRFAVQPSLVYAESAFELAYLYYSEDREEECLTMAKVSFESWEKMSGGSSVRTLDNRHDYAIQLAMFGRVKEAVANWEEIIRLTPQSDAQEKTKRVFLWRSLACIAEFLGDYKDAEIWNKNLVDHCSAIYNTTHVHVLDYQLILAESILRQGRYDEALEIAELVLHACQGKSEWRITASCVQVKAEYFRLTGQVDQELKHQYECLDMLEQRLGKQHNDAFDTKEAIARCLIKQDRWQDAAATSGEVLEWRNSKLEPKHHDVLIAMQLVAICQIQQGNNAAAEKLLVEIFERNSEAVDLSLFETICASLWNQSKWKDLAMWCQRGHELENTPSSPLQVARIIALRNDGKEGEAKEVQAAMDQTSQVFTEADVQLHPRLPPSQMAERHRFGRVIHPRTWST